ncbi:hypothetical protein D3C81_1638810 [compost metagenome]
MFIDPIDDQPDRHGHDADEGHIEQVKVVRLAYHLYADDAQHHRTDRDDRLVGKTLAPLETHDQVEQRPDTDAGAIHQHAEGAQAFEVVLPELLEHSRRHGVFVNLRFDGLEHGGSCRRR